MRKALLTATALTMIAAVAHAAPVTFFGEDLNPTGATPIAHPTSDAAQTAFLANLTSPGTENLDSFSSGTTTVAANFGNGITATLAGGTILNYSSSGRFAISSPNYYQADTSTFSINFSSPVSAFGFYGTDIGDFGGVLSLTLTDEAGNVSSLIVPASEGSGGAQPENGSVLYFGFYDLSDTYTSIAFNNSNTSDIFGFDNFTVGIASQVVPTPTPEPAGLALLGTGLLGMAAVRRRRRG